MNFRNQLLFYFFVSIAIAIIIFLIRYAKPIYLHLAHVAKLKNSQKYLRFQKKSKLIYRLRILLLLLILLMASVLIAQPYTTSKIKHASDASDVMVVIDASSSSEAYFKEIASSLRDFVDGNKGNNIGITIISGMPQVVVPPTSDYQRLNPVISDLANMDSQNFLGKWSSGSSEGSAIGDAIILATDSFGQTNPRQKIMLIFSDGLNNRGHDIENASHYAAVRNIVVISADLTATGQSPQPSDDLKKLSEQTGGQYITLDKPKNAEDAVRLVKSRVQVNHNDIAYHEIPTPFIFALIIFMTTLLFIDKWGLR